MPIPPSTTTPTPWPPRGHSPPPASAGQRARRQHLQPQDPPGCAAWVQVRTESLDPDQLLAALKAGHYYSSTGPELLDVSLTSGHITVRCSPVRKVLITGGAPGAQVVQGKDLMDCTLPLTMFRGGFCRVTIEDDTGGRAWSNPIHLAPTAAADTR
ncbi:hypothetical protein OG462_04895 [Streptomyces sp. NBC_01077]|uniref:hypothetical protein n=1 Tax=Streptomyces sp. NBC_01077 TaxID=2903746 RepID=UPI00386CACCF|nr:hypothetical protein OG462_04895 [Streptomyces sp. NBC_01077]